jgi:hypothetical protein
MSEENVEIIRRSIDAFNRGPARGAVVEPKVSRPYVANVTHSRDERVYGLLDEPKRSARRQQRGERLAGA